MTISTCIKVVMNTLTDEQVDADAKPLSQLNYLLTLDLGNVEQMSGKCVLERQHGIGGYQRRNEGAAR